MRIVSMLPSATEIVYALGLEDQLLAVTFECDEPPRARREKQIIVGGTDTSSMTPAQIDATVRRRLAAGEDLYTLDTGAFAALQPDLILTQDLCRVCAVPTDLVRDAVAQLGCSAEVVTLDPYSLEEVLDSILEVGRATETTTRAQRLVAELRGRIDRVRGAVRGLPPPRVAVIEWVDPPFGAGHWMPDVVSAAGGEPVACRPRERSVPIGWDEIAAARPQIMIISPCGFGLQGATDQARTIVEDASIISRFPDTRVWSIDGDGLLVRPGPRLVEGIETLARIIHPEAFPSAPPVLEACQLRR